MTIRSVAAAAPLTPLLTGPPRAGRVLAVFRTAALLDMTAGGVVRTGATPEGEGAGAVIPTGAGPSIVALLTREASGTPNGVRLPVSAGDRPFSGWRPGDPVLAGAREITVGDSRLRLARTWRTTVPTIRPTPDVLNWVTNYGADAPIGVPQPPLAALADALTRNGFGGDLRTAVRGLVGLGMGLTPGGDDVLAGLLIGLRATGRCGLLHQVRRSIGSDVADRTTAVSADLLRLAAAGHAATEALRLLGALHAASTCPTEVRHRDLLHAAVDALLAVGHTSGADLLHGLLLGLRPAARTTCRVVDASTAPASVTSRRATT